MTAMRQSENRKTVGMTKSPTPTWTILRAASREHPRNRRRSSAAAAPAPPYA